MGKMATVARILLGLIFFVFGLNGFLNFIPQPEELPEKLQAFTTGLMSAGYLFPLVKGTEVICGSLLLANRFVPLALVVLAPIIVNITGVHIFLAPSGLVMALLICVLEAYLAFFVSPYRERILPLFRK